MSPGQQYAVTTKAMAYDRGVVTRRCGTAHGRWGGGGTQNSMYGTTVFLFQIIDFFYIYLQADFKSLNSSTSGY